MISNAASSHKGYIDKKSARRMDDVVKYTILSGKKALEDSIAEHKDIYVRSGQDL